MTDNFNIDQLGERYANFYTDFEIAKFSPEERRDYEESMKNFRDLYASLETKYNKGAKDTLKKVVANMLSMNMDVFVIASATGLSIEQIEDLKKHIN